MEMYQKKDALRAKVILGKYYSQSRRLSKDLEKLPCSTNWKAIKMGFPIFSKGICYNVGNGTTLNFWIDKWMRECSPKELIEGPINKMESNMTVADMLQGNEWNWNALSFELPNSILDKIKATPIQMYRDKKDTPS
nr:hypothetical protein CFP56_45999 [Quercus suber]